MGFQTKDSGERQEFESGMVRDTQEGKARFDLLLPEGIPYSMQFITRLGALMERGAKKYGERNWEKADSDAEFERARASALRHMIQWAAGETDEDHAAAVVFNLLEAETILAKNSVELDTFFNQTFVPTHWCDAETTGGALCANVSGHDGPHTWDDGDDS